MKHYRFGTFAVLVAAVLLSALVVAGSASATPVTVNLRIEGSSGTLYEGPITTDGKMVTTQAGGTHQCDGTQGSGNTNTPGGTPTTALDDAAHATGFTWDGGYDSGFGDFLVERIGTDGQVGVFGSSFWGVSVNRVALQVGGCQSRVQNGDDVLWDWTVFQAPNLQLTAPSRAQAGVPVTVNVQQYGDNGVLSPAGGASVDGQTTDSSGNATLTFPSTGIQHFKATLSGANRSNAATVCVYATSPSECGPPATPANPGGVKDRVAPTIALVGIANHKHYRRGHGPRKLAGRASDSGGLFQVYFRLRRFTHSGCQWYSSKRSVFTNRKPHCKARFQRVGTKSSWSYLLPSRLGPGSYTLETKAIDKSYNAARTRVEFTVAG
jgi:hypothetical protein